MNISQIILADIIGKKKSVVSSYESGSAEPPINVVLTIAGHFHVDPKDLLFSRLSNLSGDRQGIKVANISEHAEKYTVKPISSLRKARMPVQDTQSIPLYDPETLQAAAGLSGIFHSDREVTLYSINIPNLPKSDGAMYITGDSMYPLLKSGDIVIFKQWDVSDLFYGEMYILSVALVGGDEYLTVKYVQKSEQPGYVNLISHNSNHQSREIPISSIRAIAKVTASIRIN